MGSLASETGDDKDAINEQRAIRRRQMARSTKDVRSRLGAPEHRHTAFDLERQHLFADTRINAAYAVPLLALIAFLVLTIHQRLRMYPMPQQCLMVFLLLGINQMLVHFVKQLLGADDAGFSYLWPALTSALVWPVFCILLDNINRKLG